MVKQRVHYLCKMPGHANGYRDEKMSLKIYINVKKKCIIIYCYLMEYKYILIKHTGKFIVH